MADQDKCSTSPTLLDRKAIAVRFGVSTKTIDRWRAIGYLPEPVFRPGRKRYWSVWQINSVDKLRQSGTLGSEPI